MTDDVKWFFATRKFYGKGCENMKHLGNLSIHLFKNAIVMNYTNHKQFFIQRKKFKDIEQFKLRVEQMLDSLLEKTSLKTFQDMNTYIIAPSNLVKYQTLIPLPNLGELKTQKKLEALELYVEQNQKIKIEDSSYSFSFEGKKQEKKQKDPIEGNFFSFVYIDQKKIAPYLDVLFEQGLNLKWMETEELAIRRYTNKSGLTSNDQNTVYIYQFIDGHDSYVGFFIFIGPLLAAARYLREDMFSTPELIEEMNQVLEHTRSHFKGLLIDSYILFGDKTDSIESFKQYFTTTNLQILEKHFVPTYGNLLLGKKSMFGELFTKRGGV